MTDNCPFRKFYPAWIRIVRQNHRIIKSGVDLELIFGRRVVAAVSGIGNDNILLVLDRASNHRCGELALPDNISLLFLPPYSPELNPKENLWDEIREKIFKNYALKSIDAVRARLKQANPLYRTQSQNRQIHHVIPLYRQVTLMWRWYECKSPMLLPAPAFHVPWSSTFIPSPVAA